MSGGCHREGRVGISKVGASLRVSKVEVVAASSFVAALKTIRCQPFTSPVTAASSVELSSRSSQVAEFDLSHH